MKRSLSVLALVLPLAAFAMACSSATDDGGSTGDDPGGGDPGGGAGAGGGRPSADGGVADPIATLHVVGRTDRRDPEGPRFSWPGTQIRSRFSGTGVVLRLRDSGMNQFEVSIDGAPGVLLVTNDATERYPLATGLADGEHDLVVTRRTEASFGVTQLLGVESTEGRPLVPTAGPFTRRLEFVGDSISCGYGVLGNAPCAFDATTESEPDAFTGLTAAALSAAHATIAYSGLGALRDYGGGTTEQMPVRYMRALADDSTSEWDWSYTPDAIVVNLGTNDFAEGDPGPSFQSAYEGFLSFLRGKYPNAHLVGALSPMLSDGYPEGGRQRTLARQYIEGAVDARIAVGDKNVEFFEFDLQTGESGYGCDYHPNVTTQKAMSAKLVAALRSSMGW